MSSWSELRPLGGEAVPSSAPSRVLRGSAARRVTGAPIDVDLAARAAQHRGIPPEVLAEVTEEARRAAAAEGYADGLAGLARDFGVDVDEEAAPDVRAAVVALSNRERSARGLAVLAAYAAAALLLAAWSLRRRDA